jgi:hypothetical protein
MDKPSKVGSQRDQVPCNLQKKMLKPMLKSQALKTVPIFKSNGRRRYAKRVLESNFMEKCGRKLPKG